MRGKDKCKALKEIRRQIAEENDIPYAVSQCTYQGDCKGTCPKCESELRNLERELAIRQSLGRAVAVVGISTSVCAGLTACSPVDTVVNTLFGEERTGASIAETEELEGEIAVEVNGEIPETEETSAGEAAGLKETKENLPAGETEEDMQTGEILIPEETEETENWDLAGDIALPPEEQETEEGAALPEEVTP